MPSSPATVRSSLSTMRRLEGPAEAELARVRADADARMAAPDGLAALVAADSLAAEATEAAGAGAAGASERRTRQYRGYA